MYISRNTVEMVVPNHLLKFKVQILYFMRLLHNLWLGYITEVSSTPFVR